jgi:Domain of unknown function (DUF4124)
MKSALLFAALLLSAAPMFAAHEKVYKWVDAEGATHYSQAPPPSTSAEEISVPTARKTTASAPAPPQQEAQPAPEQAGTAGNEGRQAAESQAIGEEVCRKLRDYLFKLQQTSKRLYEHDKAGNIYWLTDEDRQQRIADTQKQLTKFCQTGNNAEKP